MSTDLVGTRTIEETMDDYSPVYVPFYSNFLGKSFGYEETVGVVNFRRAEAIGDIRNKHLLPKDTEIKQIAVSEGKKAFKKYFFGSQYQVSELQEDLDSSAVVTEVLDEHQKQMDELFLTGEGTAADSSIVNNGLYWSLDPNYLLNSSVALTDDANGSYLT